MTTSVSDQQTQAEEYFRHAAREWREKASGQRGGNVIRQRNGYVLRAADGLPRLAHALDIGCGTGELTCALARRGARTVGVDFAAEMIELCRQTARAEQLANVEFVEASIFDYDPGDRRFDLIAANGFIEYISPAELTRLLEQCHRQLNDDGVLVVGSRNRLFNAVSFNDFTRMEIEAGSLMDLVYEIMVISEQASRADLLAALRKTVPCGLADVATHPRTGIAVATRHQYTPAQLVHRLARHGFRTIDIQPLHVHAAGPRFAQDHPAEHQMLAEYVQQYADQRPYLLPLASTFMIQAVKER